MRRNRMLCLLVTALAVALTLVWASNVARADEATPELEISTIDDLIG